MPQPWVTNTVDDTVTLVDLAALDAVATYPVGERPNGITLGLSSVTGTGAETPLLMPAPYAPATEGHDHDEHGHVGNKDQGTDEGGHGGDDHAEDGSTSDHH